MVDKLYIDYCGVGKVGKLLGRMDAAKVESCAMPCITRSCGDCEKQFCADVTYRGKTRRVHELLARDFLDTVHSQTRVDLRPYIKGPKP